MNAHRNPEALNRANAHAAAEQGSHSAAQWAEFRARLGDPAPFLTAIDEADKLAIPYSRAVDPYNRELAYRIFTYGIVAVALVGIALTVLL